MSRRELLDQIETLTKRLQKQENIVKRKEAYIKFLKEKLNDRHRMTDEIRGLALKIGNLCNPTIGNTAEQEWNSVVSRATDGASIFVSSNVLEAASSNFNDETSQQETAGDETGGGDSETSQMFNLFDQRKGVQAISFSANNRTEKLNQRVDHIYNRKRRNSRERNKATNVSYSIERNLTQSSHRLEYSAETATMQELLGANGSAGRIQTMSDPAQPAKSFLSSRFRKRKKLKPPKLPTEVKDFLQGGEDTRSSSEVILLNNSERMSTSASPTMTLEAVGVRMSLISTADSAKYEQSVTMNNQPRSMSDRSLSSLAEVLPSLPSDHSLIPLGNKNSEGRKALIPLGNQNSEGRRGYRYGVDL